MEFIFDRTQADVDRVKDLNKKYLSGTITDEEKEEWLAGSKGALNLSDLNRIENNIETLASYFIVTVSVKNWSLGDIPRVSDYARILENVQKIKNAWFVLPEAPPTPMQPLTTYQKWNDIEQILYEINSAYERYINSFYYCGDEIYAGDIGII